MEEHYVELTWLFIMFTVVFIAYKDAIYSEEHFKIESCTTDQENTGFIIKLCSYFLLSVYHEWLKCD